jgi:glutaredoxin 3
MSTSLYIWAMIWILALFFLFALFRYTQATRPKKMVSREVVKSVQNLIQTNPVFVASKSYCPYCKSSLGTFASLGIKPTVLQLDEIPEGDDIQAALKEITGQGTVPNIFIEGKHIGGNSDLQSLKSSGQLERLLKL